MSKHRFQPTDTQGFDICCIHCGRYASLENVPDWNKALREDCIMSKASRYAKKFDIKKKTVRKEIKKFEKDKKAKSK